MSERGMKFRQDWINLNVTNVEWKSVSLHFAKQLRNRCVAEAASQGITLEELESDGSSVDNRIVASLDIDT